MRKTVMTSVLVAVGGMGLIASGVASAATPTPTSKPYSYTDTDGGTCGNTWALDLGNRQFTQPTPDPAGNYAIVENFTNGRFSTVEGVSPGACDPPSRTNNGHLVREGLPGWFWGNEHLFIQGGSFTAGDGSCNGHPSSDTANPCTTGSYVAYHYPGNTGTTVTSYVFTYKTSARGALGTKTWKEFSSNGTSETDTGDIYSS
jgi:hypothetical protein